MREGLSVELEDAGKSSSHKFSSALTCVSVWLMVVHEITHGGYVSVKDEDDVGAELQLAKEHVEARTIPSRGLSRRMKRKKLIKPLKRAKRGPPKMAVMGASKAILFFVWSDLLEARREYGGDCTIEQPLHELQVH